METFRYLNVRGETVLIIHPPDGDRSQLELHLSRIGLRTEALWPAPPISIKAKYLFVKLGVQYQSVDASVRIAIMDSESPTEISRLLQGVFDGFITKPLKPLGLLSLLAHSAMTADANREGLKRIAALENKVAMQRHVERAKELLMKQLDVSGDEAFGRMRRMAMNERKSIEDIACEIVHAHATIRKMSSSG